MPGVTALTQETIWPFFALCPLTLAGLTPYKLTKIPAAQLKNWGRLVLSELTRWRYRAKQTHL